jgi:hypothetical protein
MALPSRRVWWPVAAAVLAAAPALADEIHMKGGGRVSGRIVEKTATRVTIETGPGRVTLPLSRVERIVEGRSALEAFAERAFSLGAGDVAGWAELARWAEERDLLTQARGAWQRVLATDPTNPEANAGLGRVALDGVWMSRDDAYRARGYVSYEGRWLTPAEHEAALREREADATAALQMREASLRVQEAEARVSEAEQRVREAEAAANMSGGIPLDYAYGGYAYGGYTGYYGGYGIPGGVGTGHGRPARPSGAWRARSSGSTDGRPGHGMKPAPPQTRPPQAPPARPAPPRQHAGVIQPPAQPAPPAQTKR